MLKKLIIKGWRLSFTQTAKSLYWIFTGNGITVVLAFFSTILIAKYLSKEAFGIYLALYSFSALIADLADMGIGPSLSNFIPKLKSEKKEDQISSLLSSAFYIQLMFSSFIVGLILIFRIQLAKYFFAETELINIYITAALVYAILFFNFLILSLTAQKMFRESVVVNIFSSLLRLLIIFLVTLISKLSINIVLSIYLVTFLAGWFYSFLYLDKNYLKYQLKWAKIREIFKFSGFLGLQKIFIAVSSRLDLLMLVPLAGAYEAGIYGAALRISQIFPFFVSGFSLVVAPRFAEYQKGQHAVSFFKKSLLISLLFLISLGIFYFLSDLLIKVLFPKYYESIPVLKWLIISMLGFILATPFVSFLTYTFKKPVIIAGATIVQFFIIIVCNWIFIPKIGRFGPVIGVGLGNLAVLIISVVSTYIFLYRENENRN